MSEQNERTTVEHRRYRFHELRSMAQKQRIKRWGVMNKDHLCRALGIVRVEHLPKYVLRNTMDYTVWYSVCKMGKGLGINTGNIFYAITNNKPLRVHGVLHTIEKVRL